MSDLKDPTNAIIVAARCLEGHDDEAVAMQHWKQVFTDNPLFNREKEEDTKEYYELDNSKIEMYEKLVEHGCLRALKFIDAKYNYEFTLDRFDYMLVFAARHGSVEIAEWVTSKMAEVYYNHRNNLYYRALGVALVHDTAGARLDTNFCWYVLCGPHRLV